MIRQKRSQVAPARIACDGFALLVSLQKIPRRRFEFSSGHVCVGAGSVAARCLRSVEAKGKTTARSWCVFLGMFVAFATVIVMFFLRDALP